MKINSNVKVTLLLWMLCCTLKGYSQTTTIDYLASSLSTSACNVFNPQVTINGIMHTSHAGGATFNTTNGLILAIKPQDNPPGATAYVINYNFTPGYNYSISITAKGDPAVLLKTSVVPNFNQFSTNGTTSCTADNYAYSYNTVGYGQLSTATASNSAAYSIPQFNITGSSAYPYLVIWASGGRSNLALDALAISKVTITKTAITSFTITPATVSIPCGSTSPVTFTINNGGGTTGITGYKWNLGASNNGWLYNGVAAPQTISTGNTVNSLTLSPVCGTVQSNVSATVAANGNNYNTNASTVTVTQPAYSISGSGTLCNSTGTYSITPALPCNATVTWQSSNTSIASISANGSPATATKTGVGSVTFTATATGCGASQIVTIPVAIGSVSPGAILTGPSTSWDIELYIYPVAGATSYNWYKNGVLIANQHGTDCDVPMTCGVNTQVSVEAISACGTSVKVYKTVKVNCSGFFKVSPNPASNSIVITSMQNNAMKTAVSNGGAFNEIKVFDLEGRLKKVHKYDNVNQATLDISGLANGIYFIEISNSQNKERQKIMVQK